MVKKELVSLLAFSLIAFSSLPLATRAQETCPTNIEGYSDAQLQQFLKVCEQEITSQQQVLSLTRKQANTIAKIITELKAKIKKSELEIKARNIKISQLGENITVHQKNIESLSQRIGDMDESIRGLLRKSHQLSDNSPVLALLSGQSLSAFFANLDDFAAVQGKLQIIIGEVKQARAETQDEKKSLETSKLKETELRYEQQQQKKQTESFKYQQEEVLKLTQAQAKGYQQKIAALEAAKAAIANRIFRTVGGQELPFGEALKLVRMYADRIGVAPALTLAVLSQESSIGGLIGKNIGKCTYNQSASNSDGTVMARNQQASFLAITNELSLAADTTPVSCPIYSDGSYGGAMGPAQFMPNTWWNVATQMGYKQRVANVMGLLLPNPFHNLEAFTGTALYLSDAQGRCAGAFADIFRQRACTAAKYYAGLTIAGGKLARYMNPTSSYGYQVAIRAAGFERDIATLDQ